MGSDTIAAPCCVTCAGEPGPAGWSESAASSVADAAGSAASGRPAGGSRGAAAPGRGRLSDAHTHTHTVTLSGPVGGSILTHSLTNSPTNQLTQVESVCDISAPLLHLQQLHLQLQLQNTKQEVGHSVQSPEGGSVNGCLRGNTTSSSCRCVPILCSAWRSLEEKAGLNPEEARPIST